jgi:membrane fusion protein (multidrug efflux system)
MRIVRILILLIVAAGGAAFWWWARVPEVRVAEVGNGPAVQAVYATGVVEPVSWAKVTPLSRGRIAEICSACEGAKVAKGDELARLDDREARAQIAELKAREKFLKAEVARYRALVERKVASSQVYERTQSEYRQVRAAIAAADQRLADLVLRAPLDGEVLRKDGEVGEVAEPGQVLFWVGQPRPLWIVAEVDEEDIPLVAVGQKTLIRADAFAQRALEGTVARITPKGDPINKNYRVRVALPDDTPLLIGMTTEINIVVRRVADTILAPADAIQNDAAFVIDGDKARRVAIKTGIRGGEKVQVLEGLKPGQAVILSPPQSLKDGARVRVVR